MPAPAVLTPAVIRQHVRAIRGKRPNERVIGIRTGGGWAGPPTLEIDGATADVVRVVSPLQARELITERDERSPVLVLLTDLSNDELGTDVLCRLALRQPMIPDAWSLVIDAFKARDLDPRLLKHRWMATALLEAMPPQGYAPVAAGVLDSETAWALVLDGRLGLRVARPDAPALLEWLSAPGNVDRLKALPEEIRNGVRAWLGESAGPAGLAMLDASAAAAPADLVALGLACTALFDATAAPYADAREAVIRLEPFVGGRALPGRDAGAWASAALALVRQRGQDDRRIRGWCDRADAMLADLGAAGSAWRSDVLPRGFGQRCERAADAIGRALDAFDEPDGSARANAVRELLASAAAAVALVQSHRLATVDAQRDRVERLTMALRLVRWLVSSRADPAGSLVQAARAHVEDASFADWARTAIRGGDPSAVVSAALSRVAGAVRVRREANGARFAALLAGWIDAGATGALLTEHVVREIVAPAAHAGPVLFLVVDGMSAAVFHELTTSILEEGWLPVTAGQRASPETVVALLPSVTECCRASLFAGALTHGPADRERAAFESQPLLVAESQPGKPPILIHKRDLGDGGEALPVAVRAELESADRRVVGVVVNAVDDHLLKADQVRSRWTLPNVPVVRALLHAAREGRRLVVLTSDHGHVLETGTSQLSGGDADRWRAEDGALREGEALFRGPRVMTPSQACVAAVGESVRYRSRKNGYHGGATAQEVVVPLAVFAPPEVTLHGWGEAGLAKPEWWEPVTVAATPVPAAPPAPAPRDKVAAPLLRIAEQGEPAAVPTSLVDLLLRSDIFQAQRQQHARLALDDARVKAVLEFLLGRGGRSTRTAIAAQLGLPPFRVAGQLTVLRTLLNIDAYPVLSVDDASETVELNVEFLRTQFEL